MGMLLVQLQLGPGLRAWGLESAGVAESRNSKLVAVPNSVLLESRAPTGTLNLPKRHAVGSRGRKERLGSDKKV